MLTSWQVSFNSKADEGQRIQQLSGGQKSLVALATGKSASASNSLSNAHLRLQSLPFRNAILPPSTYSTRSTPTSTLSIELL